MGLFSGVKKAFRGVAKVALPAAAGYFLGGGSGIGSALINGGLSYLGQSSANAFNAAQAADSRDWQERMRATQYQVAVGDMLAAGLNPMLAYQQGGAGNLSGAVAAPAQSDFGQFVSSALQTRQIEGQLEQMEAQNEQINAGTQESKDRALLARQQAQTEVNRSYREGAEGIRTEQATALDRLESAARIHLMAAQARNFDANSAYTALQRLHGELDLSGRRIDDWTRRTDFGKYGRAVGTFFGDLGSVTNILRGR